MKLYHAFQIGDRLKVGPILVNGTDAKSFAQKLDPLALVPGAAGPHATIKFGRIASPMFTLAACLQPLHADMLASSAALAGPPMWDEVRFPSPVYPMDRLFVEAEVTDKKLGSDGGLVTQTVRARNQNDVVVLTARVTWPVVAAPRISVVKREVSPA